MTLNLAGKTAGNRVKNSYKDKKQMLKRITAILLLVLCFSLQVSVAPAVASSLKPYVDTTKGYKFLYPNGWLAVKVKNGPDVVFHDLIEQTENVSVVISPVSDGKTLADLGTPGEVGYKLLKNAIAPPNSNREAELLNAEARQKNAKNYYILEYAVKLPNQARHNLASVAVSRGKLLTFNASTTESRWQKVQTTLKQVVDSFTVD